MDRGSSRQHAGPRRSALSLRDDFASCSMSSTTGGYSLAHELVSALEPSESGARSLAEEFGIDLGEEEDRGQSGPFELRSLLLCLSTTREGCVGEKEGAIQL